jgi:hypothetical protein
MSSRVESSLFHHVLDVITFAAYALIIVEEGDVEEGDEEGSGEGKRRVRPDPIKSLGQLDRGSGSGGEPKRGLREPSFNLPERCSRAISAGESFHAAPDQRK